MGGQAINCLLRDDHDCSGCDLTTMKMEEEPFTRESGAGISLDNDLHMDRCERGFNS